MSLSIALPGTQPQEPVTSGVTTEPTSNGGVVVTGTKEELILGKFKSVEDLTKAYTELEKKQGAPKADPPASTETTTPPAGIQTIQDATATLAAKGLDYNKYAQEYAQTGAISSGSYHEMFSKGITPQQIDGFITSQAGTISQMKAETERNTKEIYDHAGGKESYQKLMQFASTAFSTEQILSYNKAIQNSDKEAAKALLNVLKTKFDASLGVEPNLGDGGQPPSGPSGDIFTSREEYHAALDTIQYEQDPAYRQKVDAKLERSIKVWYKQ